MNTPPIDRAVPMTKAWRNSPLADALRLLAAANPGDSMLFKYSEWARYKNIADQIQSAVSRAEFKGTFTTRRTSLGVRVYVLPCD